jgi:UDP-2,4-diacetamido-2,4,6-trideoxy-beta-L-altropyranose hydrolase
MSTMSQALMKQKIWIRADASVRIGTGHVMRCLTLAKQCRAQGAEVTFFCRQADGDMRNFILQEGFPLHMFPSLLESQIEAPEEMLEYLKDQPSPPDWLIVDHYGIDHQCETKLRLWVKGLFVIDDLANRKHDCDGLLDQNLQPGMEQRYRGLVPDDCQLFMGPSFALLRDEFHEERARLRKRDGQIHKILVSFGGSDPTGESRKAFEALANWPDPSFQVDLIAGAANPDLDWLVSQAADIAHINVHPYSNQMASLMADADLAIGAGGTTTWERLYLGLPCAVVIVADNQRSMTEEAAKHQLCWCLGDSSEVTAESIRLWLQERLQSSDEALAVSPRALAYMPYVQEGEMSPLIHFLKGGGVS